MQPVSWSTVSNVNSKDFFTCFLSRFFLIEQRVTLSVLDEFFFLRNLLPFIYRIAQEQCCAAAARDQLCDNGIKMAREQGACERPFFQGDPWETKISKVPPS